MSDNTNNLVNTYPYLRAFYDSNYQYYMLKEDLLNVPAGSIFVETEDMNFKLHKNTVSKLVLCYDKFGNTQNVRNEALRYVGGSFILPSILKYNANYFVRVFDEEGAKQEIQKLLDRDYLFEVNPWVSVKDKLPTKEDIDANDGSDMFFVTAVSGNCGIAYKSVFPSNYNVFANCWESCDTEIVTHWMPHTMPKPANDEEY